MTNVEIFLDLYRTLEEDLKEFYSGKRVRSTSLVVEFMNNEGRKYYDELDVCREVRNLLSHHSYFGGEYSVEPSARLTEALRRVIHEIENPITALDICKKTSELLTADDDGLVSELLDKMEKVGYSHVPLLKDGRLAGVVSTGAVFSYLRSCPADATKPLRVRDIASCIPVDSHRFEKYVFCSENATLSELEDLFKNEGPSKLRVAAVFVTKDGGDRRRVLGMITPWDVIRARG